MATHTGIIAVCFAMGFLSALFGCSKRDIPQETKQRFSELSPADTTRLEQQRAVISAAAKQRYGTAALTKTNADLPVLQRLLDERAFTKTQTYELQCFGIAFGDVLTSELPLRWVMV